MILRILLALVLLGGSALAQTGNGPTPPAGVPAIWSWTPANSIAGTVLGLTYHGINTGAAVGIGTKLTCDTFATGAGFDVCQENIQNVLVPTAGANHTTYYLRYDWALGPSDTSNAWTIGLDEINVSNRQPSTPGWHVDRSAGPQNSGGHLVVPESLSSYGTTVANPFTTTNGSPTVSVNDPNHILQTGQYAEFANASACNGLTINGTFQVTVVDQNTFTINGGGNASGSGTCGGAVSVGQRNGTDILFAYAVSRSAGVNDGTSRFARNYIGYNVEPNALVGVGIDPNAHGGVGFEASGAGFTLASNPITTNNTTTVSVAWANSGLTTGGSTNQFTLTGASTVGGYNPNGTHTVVTVNSTTVTYTDAGASGSGTTGGGAAVIALGTADVPDAAFEVPKGTFQNGLRLDAGSFTGNAVRLAAGQSIGYSGTGSLGLQGSNTNDNAAAGQTGEYLSNITQTGFAATVTITIASPAVVTWAGNTLAPLAGVEFSTSGALPTGLTAFANVYVTAGSVGVGGAGTFEVSDTMAHALAGVAINTSGSQSGTQTGHSTVVLTSASPTDVVGLPLAAGDYDCQGNVLPNYGGATSLTTMAVWLGNAGASTLPYNQASAATMQTGLLSGINTLSTAAIVQPNLSLATSPVRLSLAAAGMAVLSAQATFSVSSATAGGFLRCRRAR